MIIRSSTAVEKSPELVERCHSLFVEAGADVVLTATYQVSFEDFFFLEKKY